MRHLAPTLLVVASISQPTAPGAVVGLETLVHRMGAYLTSYESTISTLLADERYRQSETSLRPGNSFVIRTRTLESEVAFLRLPGDREWFGVRNVLRVDGRDVRAGGDLTHALRSSSADVAAAVRAIVKASSAHNIGAARTINMPTVPLEVLSLPHHPRLEFTLGREQRISGTPTHEIRYREKGDGGIVRDQDSRQMRTHGSAWVDASGRLWRVTMRLERTDRAERGERTAHNELRIDFASNPELGLLVPREMREEFAVRGGGQFKGQATYSNYRRFTTSARIIPQ